MEVSDRLMSLAGAWEKFACAGGSVTAEGAAQMVRHLCALAELSRDTEMRARALGDELDALTEAPFRREVGRRLTLSPEAARAGFRVIETGQVP